VGCSERLEQIHDLDLNDVLVVPMTKEEFVPSREVVSVLKAGQNVIPWLVVECKSRLIQVCPYQCLEWVCRVSGACPHPFGIPKVFSSQGHPELLGEVISGRE
jgi:hypothetical protein